MSKQKESFTDWCIEIDSLKLLSGYIQNEFDKLVADKYTTTDAIHENAEFFIEEYSKIKARLDILAEKTYKLMKEYKGKNND